MKITVVAMEIPYPPMHGGRVDIWRRLQAFQRLGVEVQLLCWTPTDPEPEDLGVLQRTVSDLQLLDYTGRTFLSRLRRGMNLLQYPLGVTSRMVHGRTLESLFQRVQQFQPDLILIDGIHASILARTLARRLEIPLIIRSHNIEHQHRAALFKAAEGWQKIPAYLTLRHLKKLEFSIFRESLAFFDISVDDLKFWESQGCRNGYFLPPLIDFTQSLTSERNENFTYDVVFLGNLNRDNNVAGIKWFLESVVPLVQLKIPQVSILIAGSNPVPSIQRLCDQTRGVDLKINPKSAIDIYSSGRVLVNPIAVGGGVSIKSIDMLALNKPIVSLEKGVYGLPEEAKPLFHLAADATSFAEAVVDSLEERRDLSKSAQEREDIIESAFGLSCINIFVQQLEELLRQSRDR